jgi:hypothetical protein
VSGLISSLPFRAADFPLIHSEVMRDLVPNGIGYHLLQLFPCARHAFMRALENRDLIGQAEPFENRAVRQRAALIQAEKAGPRGFTLNHDGDVVHAPAEARRNQAERILHQQLKFSRSQHSL